MTDVAIVGATSPAVPAKSTTVRPMSALQHAYRAAITRQVHGLHCWQGTRSQSPWVRVLSKEMAENLLEHDHGDGGAYFSKPGPPRTHFRYLLTDAVTSSSGEKWRRMRPAIERALGGGLLAQRQRHASACAECADAGCEVVEDALRRCNGLLDVRVLSAAVAGRGMTFAAVGGGDAEKEADCGGCGREAQTELEHALLDLYTDDFLSCTLVKEKSERLSRQTRRMVAAALRSHEQGRDDQEPGVPNASSRTLLSRLVDECAVLSETEIQDNLHSALLAGYQASAVLTAFVLLELASRPNLQEALHKEAAAAAVAHDRTGQLKLGKGPLVENCLRETLRVYPPIGGLPRVAACPFHSALLPAEAARSCTPGDEQLAQAVDAGTYFVFDLLAAAHAHSPTGRSWHWDPERGADAGAGEQGSATPKPFGMGPRSCPAGVLSLALVARWVHQAALRYTWTYAPYATPPESSPPPKCPGHLFDSLKSCFASLFPGTVGASQEHQPAANKTAPASYGADAALIDTTGREEVVGIGLEDWLVRWRKALKYQPTLALPVQVMLRFCHRAERAEAV